MLARLLLAITALWLALVPAQAAGPYPCDFIPKPVACQATLKLSAAYTGSALAIAK